MTNRSKNAIYSVIVIALVAMVWWWRQRQIAVPIQLQGETMATTYHLTYFDEQQRNFKVAIDSILIQVNQSINTYDPNSEVSRYNRSSSIKFKLPYLLPPIKKSHEIFMATQGAYDPTVMPLVNLWGFGWKKVDRPDTSKLDSIRTIIGFEKVQYNQDSLWKLEPRVQLDFGGIGQGYGADVITEFLKSKGITNMLVELGGEGMACGINLQTKKPWQIGILDPNSTREQQFFKAYVALQNKSFTTSGNYFNYRIVDGKKYSHTIDPVTGYPAQRAILSASVFAEDCSTADAWGTALMVMGHEKGIALLKKHPTIEAFLIYTDSTGTTQTYSTPGIAPFISLRNSP